MTYSKDHIKEEDLDRYFEKIYYGLIESLEVPEGGPFGAGVVSGSGALLSVGTNKVLTSYDPSRHAEIDAIARAGKQKSTFLFPGSLILATHFPCLMCYNAIKLSGMKDGYYIFDPEETEELFDLKGSPLLEDLNIPPEVQSADTALQLQKYSSDKVKELYYDKLVEKWHTKYKQLFPPEFFEQI